MLETGNTRKACRYYLPRFIARRGYIKLMAEFDGMFGGSGSKEFQTQVVQNIMWNKIKNILPLMHTLLSTENNARAMERFEYYFGKKFEGGEDLERIANERDKLSERYKVMFRGAKAPEPIEAVTFESIIIGTETVLDRPQLSRDLVLYQFEEYYLQALIKLEELKMNKHGKH